MRGKPAGHTAVRLLARHMPEVTATALGAWAARALCADVDPELFFPPNGDPATEARHVCSQCPVTAECLAYALNSDEAYGIWGGLDPDERKNLSRTLRSRAAADAGPVRREKPSRGAA
jgi:WhiB family redox-sensing transcriptional regulator